MEIDEELPAPGKTSIRFGKAYLEMIPDEREMYGLFRKIITVKNDNGFPIRIESEKGIMLAIYRRARRGDKIEMKTVHPKTGEPIDLALEWRPGPEE